MYFTIYKHCTCIVVLCSAAFVESVEKGDNQEESEETKHATHCAQYYL